MPESPEALIQQAQSSLAVGDTATAQASLNQLLQLYPQHPQGLLRRGFVRIRLGDPEGAVEDWESAIEIDPNMLRQMDAADFRPVVEGAIQQIKQLISQDPTNIRFQVLLGRAYGAFGRYAQALQAYTSALRLAPDEVDAGLGSAQVYVRLGQGEQALQVLQKLYELHPNNGELCARIGKLYSSLNSVVQATRFFERATTLDPNDWASHLALGQIFMRQGRHEQATARFQKTLQLKSDCAPALVGLAECCKELYRFEAAISYYQQAVAVDPRDYKALCQMGSLCIQLGGLDMGIETLLQALELNDADVEIYSSLAKAYQQKGDLGTAARYFAKTVDLNPKDFFAAYNLGLIYRSQGQIVEAADAFGRAAALRPNDSQYQYQSSRALLELGQVEDALEAAWKAVSLNPHSKESQLLYGRCCLEAGRFEKAAEAFRQAVHIDAQNVEAHYQLAVALLNLQQTEEARNSFLTVLRLSPQHAPSQLGLGHVARRTGQWQTAADHYRQAIQLDLTLKPAIFELTKLYLERNQKEAINEFIRQVCVSRKGDHRIPAGFLQDWLDALRNCEQYDLAEEALDFILNVFPTSPQAKDNHRRFHTAATRHFLQKGQLESARHHLEQLQKLHPTDPDYKELKSDFEAAETAPPPAPPSPAPAAAAFDPLDEPLWEPLDLEPKATPAPARASSLTPPPLDDLFSDNFLDEPSAAPAGGGLQPPPPLDDFIEPPPATGAVFAAPSIEEVEPSAPSLGNLPPPPLEDLNLEAVSPLAEEWTAVQISRLALEDVPAGLNPQESLADLARHYLEFGLHLESCGWYKQASVFLSEARTLRPDDSTVIEHQARVLQSWGARLEDQGERDGVGQLRNWLEGLQPPAGTEVLRQESALEEISSTWGAAPEPVSAPSEPELQAEPAAAELEPIAEPEPMHEPEPVASQPAEPISPWESETESAAVESAVPEPETANPAPAPAKNGLGSELAPDWGASIPDFESTHTPLAEDFENPWGSAEPAAPEPLKRPLAQDDWSGVSPPKPTAAAEEPAVVAPLYTVGEEYDPWSAPAGPLAPPAPVSLIPPPQTEEEAASEASGESPPEPAPPEPAQAEPETAAEPQGNEIVEWMMSFQEPEAAPSPSPTPPAVREVRPPEPEPEPEVEEAVPYKSAEFEVNLSGQESAEELVQLIARYPDEPAVRSALFRAYSDDTTSLLKIFRELCQDDPDEPYHVLNLARAYAHTGSDSLAVLQYRKYVKMEATSEGYAELGEVYERMGKAELASQAKRRAQQLAEQEEMEED